MALFAMDRRGSGKSGGQRGHVLGFHQWLRDYIEGLNQVRRLQPSLKITTLGQSFGGEILAGLITSGMLDCDATIFCAPRLDQYKKLPPAELEALRSAREKVKTDPAFGETYKPVPVPDEWYATDPKYLSFMKADELMLRQVTVKMRTENLSLNDYYMAPNRSWLNKPMLFVLPTSDKIINMELSRAAIQKMSGGKFELAEFPTTDHYLEFSPSRIPYLKRISDFAQSV